MTETILFWTNVFNEHKFERYRIEYCGEDKPKCVITHDRMKISTAKAVLFFALDIRFRDLPFKEPGQNWIFMTQEPPDRFEGYSTSDANTAKFDYAMTHRMDSHFPVPYFSNETLRYSLMPVNPPIYTRNKHAIVWIASNCDAWNDRSNLVRALMKQGVSVDSYGNCLHNKDFEKDEGARDDIYTSVLPILRRYRIVIAMENTNCKDYVTEKVHNALAAGTIPLVAGPRSYKGFLPHPDAAIYVDDFYSIHDLAKYIKQVLNDDQVYEKHHRYRTGLMTDLDPAFVQWWHYENWSDRKGFCLLCEAAHHWRKGGVGLPDQSQYRKSTPIYNGPVSDLLERNLQCEPKGKYLLGKTFDEEDQHFLTRHWYELVLILVLIVFLRPWRWFHVRPVKTRLL